MGIKRAVTATAVALAAAGLLVTPAQAAPGETVYVQISNAVRVNWNPDAAKNYVDIWTSSAMVYGNCRPNYRCITINETLINPAWAGVTYIRSPWQADIYLNPQMRNQPLEWKTRLVKHELGHAHGLGHNPVCNSVMHTNLNCGWGFNYNEKVLIWGS